MDQDRENNPYHNGVPTHAPYPTTSSEPTPERAQRAPNVYMRAETPQFEESARNNPFSLGYDNHNAGALPSPVASPAPFVNEHPSRAADSTPVNNPYHREHTPVQRPPLSSIAPTPVSNYGNREGEPFRSTGLSYPSNSPRATPLGPRPLVSPSPIASPENASTAFQRNEFAPIPELENPYGENATPLVSGPRPPLFSAHQPSSAAYPTEHEYNQPHRNFGADTSYNPYADGYQAHPLPTQGVYPGQFDDTHNLLGRSHPVPSPYTGPHRQPSRISKHFRGAFFTSNDSDDGEDDYQDEESFRPFPVEGDQYDINTMRYESPGNYTDEYSGSDEDEDDGGYYSEGSSDESQTDITGSSVDDESLIPPPQQPRREARPTVVRLFRGNFVLDFPVPPVLLDKFPGRQEREFTHMRYSAVTCGPEAFVARNFTLRQTCYITPRATEIFICVTLYNEDDVTLARTLQGIFENIRNLVRRKNSEVWNADAWKKIVVCVVADGRKKINPRAQALLAALGLYQPGFGMSKVNSQPVEAHLYEYTTMLDVWVQGGAVKMAETNSCPIQMLFCMKEENKQKINSHRWFFQAFGPILAPKICILLDAGTQPHRKSIYHLWKTFDIHGNVGGACGEIRAALGQGWHKLYNPLVAAQNFEYKMSNILDKPLESVFGYISVLPGAFSAYRYMAIQDGPLDAYYLGETKGQPNQSQSSAGLSAPLLSEYDGNDLKMEDTPADANTLGDAPVQPPVVGQEVSPVSKVKRRKFGIFDANMYLAEDRILCFQLVMQPNRAWVSRYVKSAHAETDVPESLAELVLQRRRWLNGSFFAAIYAQAHFYSIWTSGHTVGRKFLLQLEFFYQFVTLLVSWFGVGNFFLVFRILTNSLGDSSLGFGPGRVLSAIFLWIYLCCLCTMFVLSFGNRPQGTQAFYITITTFFACLMVYLMFAAIYIAVKAAQYAVCANGGFTVKLVFQNETFRDLVISTLSTYALYLISSLMMLDPWHVFTSLFQYMLVSPSYINVLNVYAFCNIHDISWGTKSATKVETLGVAKFKESGDPEKKEFEILGLAVPMKGTQMNERYISQLKMIQDPPKKVKTVIDAEESKKDYYAMFRSVVVLLWIFTNVALVAVVLNTAGFDVFEGSSNSSDSSSSSTTKRAVDAVGGFSGGLLTRAFSAKDGSPTLLGRALEGVFRLFTRADCTAVGGADTTQTRIYLSVILWMIAALAAFRFVGATFYLVLRLLGR